jgi:hypothetical protein
MFLGNFPLTVVLEEFLMSYTTTEPRFFQKTGVLNPLRPEPQLLQEAEDLTPLSLTPPTPNPDRERLQHIIIGSQEGVRGAINHLHLLNYAEHIEWSRLFTIPTTGLLITPQPGEVFSYLLRYRRLSQEL